MPMHSTVAMPNGSTRLSISTTWIAPPRRRSAGGVGAHAAHPIRRWQRCNLSAPTIADRTEPMQSPAEARRVQCRPQGEYVVCALDGIVAPAFGTARFDDKFLHSSLNKNYKRSPVPRILTRYRTSGERPCLCPTIDTRSVTPVALLPKQRYWKSPTVQQDVLAEL
jgi:hypothetical protein